MVMELPVGHQHKPSVVTMPNPQLPYSQAREAAHRDLEAAAVLIPVHVIRAASLAGWRHCFSVSERARSTPVGTAQSHEWLFTYGFYELGPLPYL